MPSMHVSASGVRLQADLSVKGTLSSFPPPPPPSAPYMPKLHLLLALPAPLLSLLVQAVDKHTHTHVSSEPCLP